MVLYPQINLQTPWNCNITFDPLAAGQSMGLLSDAGCPGVADPGAVMVKRAHSKGFNVRPLVGPSSLLLALMSSGMNGQSFAFNGYLPIDKQERLRKIKVLEKRSGEYDQTQLFIETPYRNEQFLADLIKTLFSQHPFECGL